MAKMWHEEDGMAPAEIAQLLRRDKSTMTRLLVQRTERKKDGRPKLLDSAKVDELVACPDHLIVTADGDYKGQQNGDVAAEMYAGPIKAALSKACPRRAWWQVRDRSVILAWVSP